MGKWRWVPGGDRAGRWKLCSKSYPPTSGLPICSVASSAWGQGQRQTLPASPGFPTALFWARQRRLSPQAGECLQQLHVRLRAWAGLLVLPAGVYMPGDGKVKHGWPWDAHISSLVGLYLCPVHPSCGGVAGAAGAPWAEVGDLERGVGSRSDVCTVPVLRLLHRFGEIPSTVTQGRQLESQDIVPDPPAPSSTCCSTARSVQPLGRH